LGGERRKRKRTAGPQGRVYKRRRVYYYVKTIRYIARRFPTRQGGFKISEEIYIHLVGQSSAVAKKNLIAISGKSACVCVFRLKWTEPHDRRYTCWILNKNISRKCIKQSTGEKTAEILQKYCVVPNTTNCFVIRLTVQNRND